jgi:methylenetetrahydrofolate dehydrogenase (NADP+)/methenyltetrahydrofolate cyclohydrolase
MTETTTPSPDPKLLDGKKHAALIEEDARRETALLAERGIVPGLAVVLVGENPASKVYVRNKAATAERVGLRAWTVTLPADAPWEKLRDTVRELNARDDVDGILVQLPLPRPEEAAALLDEIDPRKDVDGFHPENVGRLDSGRPRFAPCTPAGVMEMLRREGIALKGCRAVVVGRSNIVGKPMAQLLLQADATVTICHSRTRDLPAVCREADLLVAAIGRTAMIGPEFVKEGAVVVDVGMNALTTREEVERYFPGDAKRLATLAKLGQTLIGDVDFVRVRPLAGRITPVPGGVGPLTVAMLAANTVKAARLRRGA